MMSFVDTAVTCLFALLAIHLVGINGSPSKNLCNRWKANGITIWVMGPTKNGKFLIADTSKKYYLVNMNKFTSGGNGTKASLSLIDEISFDNISSDPTLKPTNGKGAFVCQNSKSKETAICVLNDKRNKLMYVPLVKEQKVATFVVKPAGYYNSTPWSNTVFSDTKYDAVTTYGKPNKKKFELEYCQIQEAGEGRSFSFNNKEITTLSTFDDLEGGFLYGQNVYGYKGKKLFIYKNNSTEKAQQMDLVDLFQCSTDSGNSDSTTSSGKMSILGWIGIASAIVLLIAAVVATFFWFSTTKSMKNKDRSKTKSSKSLSELKSKVGKGKSQLSNSKRQVKSSTPGSKTSSQSAISSSAGNKSAIKSQLKAKSTHKSTPKSKI